MKQVSSNNTTYNNMNKSQNIIFYNYNMNSPQTSKYNNNKFSSNLFLNSNITNSKIVQII